MKEFILKKIDGKLEPLPGQNQNSQPATKSAKIKAGALDSPDLSVISKTLSK